MSLSLCLSLSVSLCLSQAYADELTCNENSACQWHEAPKLGIVPSRCEHRVGALACGNLVSKFDSFLAVAAVFMGLFFTVLGFRHVMSRFGTRPVRIRPNRELVKYGGPAPAVHLCDCCDLPSPAESPGEGADGRTLTIVSDSCCAKTNTS